MALTLLTKTQSAIAAKDDARLYRAIFNNQDVYFGVTGDLFTVEQTRLVIKPSCFVVCGRVVKIDADYNLNVSTTTGNYYINLEISPNNATPVRFVQATSLSLTSTDINANENGSYRTHFAKVVVSNGAIVTTQRMIKRYDEIQSSGSITVDEELDEESTNPVQNATITAKIAELSEGLFNTGAKAFTAIKIDRENFLQALNNQAFGGLVGATAYATQRHFIPTESVDPNYKVGHLYEIIRTGDAHPYTYTTVDRTPDIASTLLDAKLDKSGGTMTGALDMAANLNLANNKYLNFYMSGQNFRYTFHADAGGKFYLHKLNDNGTTDRTPIRIQPNGDLELNHTTNNTVNNRVSVKADGKLYINDVEVKAGGSVTVDEELDEESTNPVQNAAITAKFVETDELISQLIQAKVSYQAIPANFTQTLSNGGTAAAFWYGLARCFIAKTSADPNIVAGHIYEITRSGEAGAYTYSVSDITEILTFKDTTFRASSNSQYFDVLKSQTTNMGESGSISVVASVSAYGHKHTASDITDLPTGSSVTVDTALSSTSTNPVQNKIVKAALDSKSDSSHTHSNYATSDHTHSGYATTTALNNMLPKSGGTMTGALDMAANLNLANNKYLNFYMTNQNFRYTFHADESGKFYLHKLNSNGTTDRTPIRIQPNGDLELNHTVNNKVSVKADGKLYVNGAEVIPTGSATVAKTWVALGDSKTDFNHGRADNYPKWIIDRNPKITLTNLGSAGGLITNERVTNAGDTTPLYKSMYTKATEITGTPDIITVAGGYNDWNWAIPLGRFTTDISNYDTSASANVPTTNIVRPLKNTFYMGVFRLAKYLTERFPLTPILWITPVPTTTNNNGQSNGANVCLPLGDYVNAIKEVCAYFSIPVCDMFTAAGLTPFTASNLSNYWRNGDGVHPNGEGSKIYSYKIEKAMRETYENWGKVW